MEIGTSFLPIKIRMMKVKKYIEKYADVTILSKYILDELLGIKDQRTDKRIDFVGGIRGLGELQKRVDSEEMKVAFALYPVSLGQLINIADSGNIMPPNLLGLNLN